MTESYYLVIKLKDYYKVIKAIEDKILKDQLQFLKSIDELSGLTKNVLGRLARDFKTIDAANGMRLCKEGTPANYLWFVKSGQFLITRTMQVQAEDILNQDPSEIIESCKK